MRTITENRLADLLSIISLSLKEVTIENRFNFREINRKYKNAIFRLKDNSRNCKSNILSSSLENDILRQYYKDHACCWVNYIGCDSFSIKEKRQVFFASILMEIEDKQKNEELIEINEEIFKIYNKLLDRNIPVDIWVQLFFYGHDKIKELLKHYNGNREELLNKFDSIQNNGLVIPIGIESQNTNDGIDTLLYDRKIDAVTSSCVNKLWVNKSKVNSRDDEIINIIKSICNHQENSSYLTRKVFQLNKSLHNDVKFVYYLPVEGPNGSTGLVIYGANRELLPIEIRDLKLLGYSILFPYVSAYKSAWENEMIVKESIKSAIAAIMSRNMSHNLGSHYMYYTKASLEQLADKTGNSGPEIRGAAKALSYIQSRMDYLATIVANDKYPYGSVNFKSQILDELTVDDFSKRHYGTSPNEEFRKKLGESINKLETVREIVFSLSSLYADCDSLDDIAFSERRSTIDSKLLSLQNEIAEIDKKSIYSRTTNYLLTNLIRSENYSRPDILGRPSAEPFKNLFLFVRLWNGKRFELFTGVNTPLEMTKEEELKDKLSKINLALPGGTMSCHAFYNILENFIRNSAKYSWTDYRPEELKITISLKVDEKQQIVECTIFDNKHDALRYRDNNHRRTLLEDIVFRLSHSHILNDNQMIDKENKGLKEMLFSAVWLKANETDKTFAEIISNMEGATPKHKLALIQKMAFEFIAVNDEGLESTDYNQANLGIRFTLPLFTHVESLQGKKIKDLMKLHTDVVEVIDPTFIIPELERSYQRVFPRIFSGNVTPLLETQAVTNRVEQWDAKPEYENVMKLRHAINFNIGNIDKYALLFESTKEPGSDKKASKDCQIFFDTHFSTQASKSRIKEYYGKYAYVDTISGSNFTKTLQGLFLSGLGHRGRKFKSYNDYYLDLKIKESGLTRITLIDERLFNNVRWNENVAEKLEDESIPDEFVMDIRSTAAELSMKNIRVLNFLEGKKSYRVNDYFEKVDKLPFFYGNSFFNIGPCKESPNATHFLSIHLGLIEKLLKSKKLEKYIGERGLNPLAGHRIINLMSLLESVFGEGLQSGTHICVHSGRGNFSKELEGPLRDYPFLSLAALENAFNNSKFLLSQLFYNTIFIGKGEVNH